MTGVRWSQQALRDLDNGADHYAGVAPEHAERVGEAVLDAAEFLLGTPGAGSMFGSRGARKWSLPNLRYVIIYRPTKRGIDIARIHHASQNWRPS